MELRQGEWVNAGKMAYVFHLYSSCICHVVFRLNRSLIVSEKERQMKIGERQMKIGERQMKIGERQMKIGERQMKIGERQMKIGERQMKIGERKGR